MKGLLPSSLNKSRIWVTLNLSMCEDNSIMLKTKKSFGFDKEHLPVFKPLCRDDLEQNAGMIHESNPKHLPLSNPEHLPILKAPRKDILEQNVGTTHGSNPEHLFVFKALRGANPKQNAGTTHAYNMEHLIFS